MQIKTKLTYTTCGQGCVRRPSLVTGGCVKQHNHFGKVSGNHTTKPNIYLQVWYSNVIVNYLPKRNFKKAHTCTYATCTRMFLANGIYNRQNHAPPRRVNCRGNEGRAFAAVSSQRQQALDKVGLNPKANRRRKSTVCCWSWSVCIYSCLVVWNLLIWF